MATISITLKELEAIKAAEYKRGYRDGQSVIATGDVVKPTHEVGFQKPAAAKVEPTVTPVSAIQITDDMKEKILKAVAEDENARKNAAVIYWAVKNHGSYRPNDPNNMSVWQKAARTYKLA